jgi:predicted GNAT family N-acyltransferase
MTAGIGSRINLLSVWRGPSGVWQRDGASLMWASVARSVNTTQVAAHWLIGREIVEEEQRGKRRAGYGEELLKDLSDRLTKDREKGWSVRNLEYCRNFYVEYPLLMDIQKSNAVRSESKETESGVCP